MKWNVSNSVERAGRRDEQILSQGSQFYARTRGDRPAPSVPSPATEYNKIPTLPLQKKHWNPTPIPQMCSEHSAVTQSEQTTML